MNKIPWILLTAAVAYILFAQMCKKSIKDTTGEAELQLLIKAKNDTLAAYRAFRAKDSIEKNEAQQASADQREKVELLQNDVRSKQVTINRLISKIEVAKKESPDSSWVAVSPRYVEGCDSLKEENKSLAQSNQELEEQSAEATKLMLYEISLRDSSLDKERYFNERFQTQLNACLTTLNSKVKEKEPVQVYVGGGVLGNKINPLSGGQLNLSLRARNRQMYEVTGAIIGSTWYAGVGTKILVTFRRK